MTSRSCTVIGAGVSGLTSAIRLREAGWNAHIIAREMAEHTVSRVAAAVWTMTDAEPVERTRRWAIRSREVFAQLAADSPGAGVVPLRQLELERHDPGPSWWEETPWVQRASQLELPAGYQAGWWIAGFMIETPTYLAWALERFRELGGTISIAEVARLDDLDGLIVNCPGLGAGDLVGDAEIHPIRGQVVIVSNEGLREGISDESDPDRIAYVYPRSTEVVLGGVRQPGCADPLPDVATSERILADCRRLEPRIAGAEVIDVRVGLRPGRSSVRLEREEAGPGRTVIHNYGHGGQGYILSWGCAEEVVALAGGEG